MVLAHSKALHFQVILILLLGTSGLVAQTNSPQASQKPGWKLVWHDEFDGPNGSLPDPKKWVMETGGSGWGNEELEYYTARPENAQQRDGMLVIHIAREQYSGSDGHTREYTSARMKTEARFARKFGRIEARMKIPTGKGIWPAFWMLGKNCKSVGWPKCGEIDIMENVGSKPGVVQGTIHGPGYSGDDGLTLKHQINGKFSDDFHVYAIEWQKNEIRFYVDDTLYGTRLPGDLPLGKKWVFNRPYYLILNCAVGGLWPGKPDEKTAFPQEMLVDWVRVYKSTEKQ